MSAKLVLSGYDFHIHQPYNFYIENDPANMLRSITQIPYYFISGIVIPCSAIISECIVLFLILTSVIFYNSLLFFSLFIIVVPFVLFYMKFYKAELKKIAEQSDSKYKIFYKKIFQSLEGIRELIVADKRDIFKKNVSESVSKYSDSVIRFQTITTFSPKIVELLAVISVVVIVSLGYFVLNLELKAIADYLIIFIIALYRIIPSVNKVILSVNNIRANEYTFQYLKSRSNESPDQKDTNSEILSFDKTIEIKNISFGYSEKAPAVLNNLNLTIGKGEKIGIIGVSGSGKTTFLNILLRLFKEQKGEILVDGTALSSRNIKAWYKLVSYVPQNIVLLDGSLLENIAFGVEEKDIDKGLVNKVLEVVQLKQFIETLPEGINTQTGDRGVKLSGGQIQRIGIARALYQKKAVLIFDEATSALDIETEQQLITSLNSFMSKNITQIIVSHRMQTLKYCSGLYKVENGSLVTEKINT